MIGDGSKLKKRSKRSKLQESIKPATQEIYGEVYINEIAATVVNNGFPFIALTNSSLEKNNLPFPIGSIIVREKLVQKDQPIVESLAIMIKRERSFNPESNGWQFLYLNPNTFAITKNNQTLCLSCHKLKQDNDFIFDYYF
ncbi:MAG: cytochrome P460 family protein [Acidobacteriota bacterium]